jgi:predicted pyridoxine 5'-phosphate oxidase superfamily flavin-nucleotide-binding protein
MIISEEMKKVIEDSSFISLVTVDKHGTPHPIITGKGDVLGDTVVFGIYKMEVTQKNLASNGKAWLTAATMDGGPKGYRLSGTAVKQDNQVIFNAEIAEKLI